MRIRVPKKFLPVIIVGVLLMALVPAVSAYEAHTVNVRAHIEDSNNLTKTMRPATQTELDNLPWEIDFPSTPYIDPQEVYVYQDIEGIWHVPVGKVIVWMVEITVSNPHLYVMTDVMVRDHFGAELTGMDEGVIYPDPPSHLEEWGTVGDGIYWVRGAGEVSFTEYHPENAGPVLFYYRKQDPPETPQFTIFWYANYTGGDPHMNQPVKENDLMNKAQVPPVNNSGDILPGGSTTLTLMVWTRINPGQGGDPHQEYTSAGINYFLNSGPTAWWRDVSKPGQYSASAPSLPVIVD